MKLDLESACRHVEAAVVEGEGWIVVGGEGGELVEESPAGVFFR